MGKEEVNLYVNTHIPALFSFPQIEKEASEGKLSKTFLPIYLFILFYFFQQKKGGGSF